MDARIRPATTADLFWLRLLLGQLVADHAMYPTITPKDLETQTAIMASRLAGQDPSFLCFVAESEDVVGGFMMGDMLGRTGEPRVYAFCTFFYLVPGWRGHGVGRALTRAFFDDAQAKGAQAIESVSQAGDTQWLDRGWPIVGTVHSLPLEAAYTTVVSTHRGTNGG